MPNPADVSSIHSAGKPIKQKPPPEFWESFNAKNINAQTQTLVPGPAMQRTVRPRTTQSQVLG